MTLLDWLILKFPTAKRTTFREMIADNRVEIAGRRSRERITFKEEVGDGSMVRVLDHAIATAKAGKATLPFKRIHEDEDVLVIDKPAGLLTSTVPHELRPTALAIVTDYFAATSPAARVGLIHRLDRDASGLLVFSKNADAFRSLKAQFFDHSVLRVYHAIVDGLLDPPAGRIESRLIEGIDGKVTTSDRSTIGERAISEYFTVSTRGVYALVRVTLYTGRKHQIRVHLSDAGSSIVNDPTYNRRPVLGRMMLAATQLAFEHPRSGKQVNFELKLPKEMTHFLEPLDPRSHTNA